MSLLQNIVYPGEHTRQASIGLLILRVALGIFMLTHGYGKFLKLFSGEPVQFADPIGIGETASIVLAVFSEVFCALFLIAGFATRFSAIPLSITMLVAAIVVHANDGFGKQELPLLFASICIALIFTGAGKISIDQLLLNNKKKRHG